MSNVVASFKIDSCIDLSTQEIIGSKIHPQVNKIKVIQTEVERWGASNLVNVHFYPDMNTHEQVDIAEEVRETRFDYCFSHRNRR